MHPRRELISDIGLLARSAGTAVATSGDQMILAMGPGMHAFGHPCGCGVP